MLKFRNLLKPAFSPLRCSVRTKVFPNFFTQYLKNIPETEISKLPNGLTIATEERECPHACIGLYIDGGSRYEHDFENGIAHFFEHIAFKSTRARSNEVLEKQMACTGATFRAFTSREMVVYYAECLCVDVTLVVDLLSDCVFNNCLSSEDIDYQKNVVYLEMEKHDQDHNSLVDDYLHLSAFQGTPLGQTVMGPSCNLHNFCDSTITTFLERCFDPTRTVLVGVGGITHEQMVHLGDVYFGKFETAKCMDFDTYRYTGSQIVYRNDSLPLANIAMAVEGPCFNDDDHYTLDVAATFIGGWDSTQVGQDYHATHLARAASTIGCCDSYRSFNIKYKDTSLWGIKFMSPSTLIDDMFYLVQNEWMRLCNMITDSEVHRAKNQLKTNLLTKTESARGTCHDIGRWVLYNGYRPALHERMHVIDKINAADVQQICTNYIYDRCPVVAGVGPVENIPEYNRIRAGMYWLRT